MERELVVLLSGHYHFFSVSTAKVQNHFYFCSMFND